MGLPRHRRTAAHRPGSRGPTACQRLRGGLWSAIRGYSRSLLEAGILIAGYGPIPRRQDDPQAWSGTPADVAEPWQDTPPGLPLEPPRRTVRTLDEWLWEIELSEGRED